MRYVKDKSRMEVLYREGPGSYFCACWLWIGDLVSTEDLNNGGAC